MSMMIPPWLYIVLGWVALFGATAVTVRVCQRNAPESVPLECVLPPETSHAR
jgi:hypothetical protein